MRIDPQAAADHVTSSTQGRYHCSACGTDWTAGPKWLWWPVALHWRGRRGWLDGTGLRRLYRGLRWGISSHGVEIGYRGLERPVVRRIWSIGPLQLRFGPESLVRP
jgi:hypothetical protein